MASTEEGDFLINKGYQKVDGRKTTTGCAFPYRLSNAAKARTIKMFEETGSSVHSSLGWTLGVLLEYCHAKRINFRLIRVNSGYYLRRV